jgi:hypothetical protein
VHPETSAHPGRALARVRRTARIIDGGSAPTAIFTAAVVQSGGTEIDIALYADVLKRHRTIVVVGVLLTLALVVLSVVRISPSGIAFRSPQVWSNQSTIVLTQQGAPELRSVLPSSGPGGTSSLADTSRFAGLIDVYTTLATSDAVVRMLERRGLIDPADMANGKSPITAAAVVSTVGGGTTPMMTLTAQALSAAKATKLTLGATNALLEFVESRQAAAKIPQKDRIQLRVVKASDEPTLVKPRSKALPILVLLGGLFATAAFAFTRDNVTRGERPTVLQSATLNEDQDAPGVVKGHHPTSTIGPVRQEPASGAADERATPVAGSRGRSTLGSVPNADAENDDDAQRRLRRTGTGRVQR